MKDLRKLHVFGGQDDGRRREVASSLQKVAIVSGIFLEICTNDFSARVAHPPSPRKRDLNFSHKILLTCLGTSNRQYPISFNQ
jgi:hypothetical protein